MNGETPNYHCKPDSEVHKSESEESNLVKHARLELELAGLHARTFLHELDHLNGKEV